MHELFNVSVLNIERLLTSGVSQTSAQQNEAMDTDTEDSTDESEEVRLVFICLLHCSICYSIKKSKRYKSISCILHIMGLAPMFL